jgi:hypothetical protein
VLSLRNSRPCKMHNGLFNPIVPQASKEFGLVEELLCQVDGASMIYMHLVSTSRRLVAFNDADRPSSFNAPQRNMTAVPQQGFASNLSSAHPNTGFPEHRRVAEAAPRASVHDNVGPQRTTRKDSTTRGTRKRTRPPVKELQGMRVVNL